MPILFGYRILYIKYTITKSDKKARNFRPVSEIIQSENPLLPPFSPFSPDLSDQAAENFPFGHFPLFFYKIYRLFLFCA